jgi:hypothetical protein
MRQVHRLRALERTEDVSMDLSDVQLLLQGLILDRRVLGDPIGGVFKDTPTLSGLQCVDIYRRMYRQRLLEVLRMDYADLARALGERIFSQLAADYINREPSRSYTLQHYGATLPEFVKTWTRADEGVRRSAAELAFLERLEAELLMRAEVTPDENLPSDCDWDSVQLIGSPTLELMTLSFVDPLGEPIQLGSILPRPVHVAVHAQGGRVTREPLTAPAHRLLMQLLTGQTLPQAIASVFPKPKENDLACIQQWFGGWFRVGYFSRVVQHSQGLRRQIDRQ